MKNQFLKTMMLALVLGMSVNLAWGQQLKVYFASLKAQTSEASTGSGDVKLTWLDITGKPFEVALGAQLNGYALGNASHISGPAETAQLIGATMCAMDGVETAQSMGGDQIYMTSYIYFCAEAEPAAGSYLSDWVFTDPAISRIDTAMGPKVYQAVWTEVEPYNWQDVYVYDEENSGPFYSPCFKVLPDTTNNAPYATEGAAAAVMMNIGKNVAENKYNNIYAVFKKYLLSNPQVTNGQLEASEGEMATLYLSVDVEGDVTQYKENFGDFVFPTYPASVYQSMSVAVQPFAEDEYGYWTWDLDDTKSPNPVTLSATKSRAYVKVTYTAKSGITVGTHRANITISVAGGAGSSSLTIPLSVNALDPSRPEATLFNGKDSIESGSFETLLSKIGSYATPVIKLKRPRSGMTLNNKTFTLDLNGNSIGDLTVNGGDVTVAYSKFGGSMSSLNIVAGKLTLNGGTIDASGIGGSQPADAVVAVNVASGATLIQNGATIRANATMCYAVGINADGNVTVTDGSIDAHAGMTGAFAVQVGTTGKLTTTGGAFNASVDQTHNPTANPADQTTWSNAYAVYVTDAAGVANLEGGTFYSTSSYGNAFAVCALATFGKMTIGKKAVVSAHTVRNQPVAYAVGSMGNANLTVNGGRYSATYTEDEEAIPCAPFLCAGFDKLQFKSGIIKADSVYVRDAMFTQTTTLIQPKLYNVVKGGTDWNEGYRYVAVDESKTTALEAGVPACRIGTVGYTKLEDAIAYANNNPNEELVIFMTNNYTLPAGYYTLPAKATLVVPMSDSQSKEVNMTAPRVVYNDAQRMTPYVEPTEFRRLTFANGVNMDVFGDIELTCSQLASNAAYTSQPTGAYGHLVMEEGSHMTLQAGSELRAWGFMTGKGETDARRDSKVREIFQLGDWKGAFTSVKIVGMVGPDQGFLYNAIGDDSDKKIFPVTQYFIQNVESPVKYHPGAVLSTSAAVSEGIGQMSVSMAATDIAVVGVNGRDAAIFLMDNMADAENTWVRKWYDAENDIQTYEINSAAHIGSMVLDMGELNVPFGNQVFSVPIRLNSAKFDLPLTSNFKIHVLSGTLDFQQNTCLLPGAEVEVDKESIVSVAMNDEELAARAANEERVYYTGALYVYDADDWNNYAFGTDENGDAYAACTKTVRYAPSWNGRPTKRNENTKVDAKINVHGTFTTATGFVYTSVGNGANSDYNPEGTPTGGANIFSSNEDAGTFIFNENASEAENPRKVYQVKLSGSGGILGRNTDYDSIPFYPARLKNGNGQYVNTDAAEAGLAYCYQDNEWKTMTVEGCFSKENRNGDDIYYAKPQEYVAVVATKDGEGNIIGNSDHTYSDAAGAGRLFILTENCQWWEVEKKDNLYHCIHPLNDTYYYWDNSVEEWKEQRYTISWLNWNGDTLETIGPDEVPVKSYSVTYGTQAEYLGTNPTREATVDYTYDFTGWTPQPGRVTSDVTYTATYEQKERKYTIIFQQEGGVEIERQFLKHNDVPVCENMPTKVGHTLQWSPAISAVIGDTTYTATWLEEPPTEYEIRFVDYDGYELQKSNVNVGELPEYTGSTPTKKNTDQASNKEFTYVFANWSPNLTKVTEAMTYTAVYREVPKEYTIKFVKENGDPDEDEDVIETKKYQYGETPSCSTPPTEPATATAGYTYKLVWMPQIQTVMGDATYTATFPGTKNKYSVTLKSNPSGACTLSGAGIYEYNTAVTISLVANEGYTFTGWSDGQDGINTTRQMAITGDINLVANFTVDDPDYTITWKSEDGLTTLAEVGQKSGTATTYTGAMPVKADENGYTFTFDGWTTAANGAGTYYRNGMTPKATANATYYAHFAATAIPNLEVSGVTVLTEPVEYQDLIITSNGTTSGQLMGVENLTLKGNAYFDYAVNAQARKWYQVAVPWEVAVEGGISVNGKVVSYSNMDVIYYDGYRRSQEGPNKCWKDVKDNGGIMIPGRLYLIALSFDAPVIRFKASDKNHLLTTNTEVSAYPESTDNNDKDAGWNGVANPALFQAYLNATGTSSLVIGQVYNPNGGYNQVVLNTTKLTVGQGAFIQVAESKSSIVVKEGADYASSAPTAAPRRNTLNDNEIINYEVRIAPINKEYTDRVFIQANADKDEDRYMVGKDLVKMGVSSSAAQMWINRYDAKLCLNTMAPEEENAEYPLSIFVPQTGEYTIGIFRTAEEQQAELYLTLDGEAIWNLSKNAYTMDMEQGTISRYGLRIHVKKTPQVATSIDEAIVDAKGEVATKVLINNHVFIIRGDKVYTINGQLVK